MHVLISSVFGNPNVGLYCYCNDSYCLVPVGTGKKMIAKYEESLGVAVHEISIAGTTLLGAFLAGNANMLLVPEIAFDYELKELDRLGIKYTVIKSRLTALGNNIVCNNTGCVINPQYTEAEAGKISLALKVPVFKSTAGELETVGSLAVANDKGCLISNDIKPSEKRVFESSLKVSISGGTVNFGSPYVSSGIIANSKGFVIGDTSSGPEIANADDALGFTDR